MFNINLKFLNNKRKGFTLVEVLVSVGIFVMIVMAISQIYIAVLHSEQVAYALLNSENNIRDNLEFMARAIRMGKEFQVSSDKKEISFEYFSGKQWETVRFYFNESIIIYTNKIQIIIYLFLILLLQKFKMFVLVLKTARLKAKQQ